MLVVSHCAVCGGGERNELVVFPDDPYMRRLSTRTSYEVRYVVCRGCGFVYQDRMMDEVEMKELYGVRYRPMDPPPDYLEQNRAVATETFSWITTHTGMRGTGRSVLDIGCATGMFLRPFAQTGWSAVGLDAGSTWVDYGRREFGLDLRKEFFTEDSFPGRTFNLILFSHVLEHVLDPAPVLAAIREKLSDDGYLFIGTPNVLAPKRKLFPGLFGGDHVRLFSTRTLSVYLRQQGFRLVQAGTFLPRGIRALAVKAEPVRTGPRPGDDRDDWKTILSLYRGLWHQDRASLLERNLASLVDYQWPVLEDLCLGLDAGSYRVRLAGGQADNVLREGSDGATLWLYGKEGSRERTGWLLERLSDRLSATVVVMGLGLGHLAEALDARLDPDCQIHIWEADRALFAAALGSRDLSALFRSRRIWLHLGPNIEFLTQLIGERSKLNLSFVKDPVSNGARHPLYGEVNAWVRAFQGLVRPSAKAVTQEAVGVGTGPTEKGTQS